jgi:hypothetical protein
MIITKAILLGAQKAQPLTFKKNALNSLRHHDSVIDDLLLDPSRHDKCSCSGWGRKV